MATLIDVARYPLGESDSVERVALVNRCKNDVQQTGAVVLPGFVDGAGVASIVAEVEPHLGKAFYKQKRHNVYLTNHDDAMPEHHPRNALQVTNSATLAYDYLPRAGLLDSIYRWPPMRQFVSKVLGYESLHPYEDELSPVNVLVYPEGAGTGWHFDIADFVVTLLLRSPHGGGVYDYAPFIRSESDEGFGKVANILDGKPDGVKALSQPEGALVIFKGHHTLHRVTPVSGELSRLVAVFSYAREAGQHTNQYNRRTFYGRED